MQCWEAGGDSIAQLRPLQFPHPLVAKCCAYTKNITSEKRSTSFHERQLPPPAMARDNFHVMGLESSTHCTARGRVHDRVDSGGERLCCLARASPLNGPVLNAPRADLIKRTFSFACQRPCVESPLHSQTRELACPPAPPKDINTAGVEHCTVQCAVSTAAAAATPRRTEALQVFLYTKAKAYRICHATLQKKGKKQTQPKKNTCRCTT